MNLRYLSLNYNNNNYNIIIDNDDASGEGCIREIINNNEYELEKFVNMKTNIIDIGANCGIATIILGKQNPESTIYSYEPDKDVFEILKKNIEVNNLKNIKIFNMAVSNNNKEKITLCKHPHYSGGNTTYSDNNTFSNHFNCNVISYDIICTSLDKIINEYNLNEIGLLKIDCEGGEYDILYDFSLLKTKIIKNIVGEFHNLPYNKVSDTYDNLIQYCKPYINGVFKLTLLDLTK